MDHTTHQGEHFTEVQKDKIRKAVHSVEEKKIGLPKRIFIFALTSIAVTMFALFITSEWSMFQSNSGSPIGGSNQLAAEDRSVRTEYIKDGKKLFAVFPDPALKAGKPYGYIFSFSEDFESLIGKELAIYVQQLDTGKRMTALEPMVVNEPSPGYPGLQRFTHRFAIPTSGLWKYEVYLDDQFYGDVILMVNKMKFPDSLPSYVQEKDFEEIDWNKKAVQFGRNMIGNENKSGVIGADMPSLNGQKWMWHLWGVYNNPDLTVVGYHRETGTIHPILQHDWTLKMAGELNGADAHIPSSVKIPEPGEWAILLYTNGELFDILIYDIRE